MTSATLALPAGTARPRLISRTLLLVFVADFAGLTSFYLLLSVVPQYMASAGAHGAGPGLATAVLMGSTVVAEFAMPRVVAALGHRAVLAIGLILLGLPVLILPVASGTLPVLAVCLLRGFGLAVIFVVCGELGAALVPEERRGEGLGVLGVVAGVPAILAMPLGVWLAGRVGFGPVFLAGAATALVGVAAVCGLPRQLTPAAHRCDPPATIGVLATLRTPGLLRPAAVFAATAVGAGAVLTFLPVAMPHGSGGLAAAALLANSVAATASRWWAGRHGDRHGASALLRPAALLAAAGVLCLAFLGSPAVVVGGAVLLGVGFGAAQNASITAMYSKVGPAAFGAVTALWSVAYDAGLGLGSAGFGLLSGPAGYPAAFVLTAVAMATVPLFRKRRSNSPSTRGAAIARQ